MSSGYRRQAPPSRRVVLALAVASLVATLAASTALTANTTTVDKPTKVRICHATSSNSNPYVSNEPAIANNGDLQGGHLNHTGPVYPEKGWGDIIPPYESLDENGQRRPSREPGVRRQAIWQNGCTPPSPPEPPAPDPITPYVQCIEPQGSGFLAHFGYDNPNSAGVTPPQDKNVFDPAPPNRGQPTTFNPGRRDDAVAAEFSGSLTWKLTGNNATADDGSPRCQGSITLVKHLVPADDPGLFSLKIDGQVEGSADAVGDRGRPARSPSRPERAP